MATPLDTTGAPVTAGTSYVPIYTVALIDTTTTSALAGADRVDQRFTGNSKLAPLSELGGGGGGLSHQQIMARGVYGGPF